MIDFQDLGLSKEEVLDRVVDRAAQFLLEQHVARLDEDGEAYDDVDKTPLGRKLTKAVRETVDKAVAKLCDEQVTPLVEAGVEGLILQETNTWGEKAGVPKTFVEYITERAEAYMKETVDFDGKDKASSRGFSFSGTQSRITHAVHKYLHYNIDRAMKTVVGNGVTILQDAIQKTVKIKLAEISEALTLSIKTK